MITGDLIRHKQEDDSLGVVMETDCGLNESEDEVQVLWLDRDYPAVEWYPAIELVITSSIGLDYKNDVLMLRT